MAIDPFHDVDLELAGMPDSTAGRSVLFNITRNVTITAPPSVLGKWDCHIATNPISQNPVATSRNLRLYALEGETGNPLDIIDVDPTQDSANVMPADTVVACAVAAGAQTFLGAGGETYTSVGIDDALPDGLGTMSRLIGGAFEVYNTTEMLHKSGSVTCYKVATQSDAADPRLQWGGSTPSAYMGRKRIDAITGPPTNEGDAKTYNGITWRAEDGCLVPIVLSVDNPPQRYVPKYGGIAVTPAGSDHPTQLWMQDSIGSTDARWTGAGSFTAPTTPITPLAIIPMYTSGAYFTGLAQETSLVVTFRGILEVFPAPGSDLVPLARPSTPLDDKALECYTRIMHSLNPGYPVGDNAAGDFFKKALGALKSIVFGVADTAAAFHPAAAAAAAGLHGAEALVKMNRAEKKKLASKTAKAIAAKQAPKLLRAR